MDDKAVEAFFPKGTVDHTKGFQHSEKFQDFFQEYISSLKKLDGVCTDTALATDRLNSRFMILMLGKNPEIMRLGAWSTDRSCLPRHLGVFGKIVNSVTTNTVNAIMFTTLCKSWYSVISHRCPLPLKMSRFYGLKQTEDIFLQVTMLSQTKHVSCHWSDGHFQGNKHQCPTAKHTDYNEKKDWMEKIQLFGADFRLKNFLWFPISKKSLLKIMWMTRTKLFFTWIVVQMSPLIIQFGNCSYSLSKLMWIHCQTLS